MSLIDLHLHSSASSDGEIPPGELLSRADSAGLCAVSIADHDTTAAYRQVSPGGAHPELIAGVEMTTLLGEKTVHLLGYFIDPFESRLLTALSSLEEAKRKQAKMRSDKLRSLGFVFTDQKLSEYAQGKLPVGPIFAMAILNNPANQNDSRLSPYRPGGARSAQPYYFFDKDYLQEGKPAFCPIERISTTDAVRLLREINSAPVLAHPGEKFHPERDVDVIESLKEAGLLGLEVFSTYHDGEQQNAFFNLAKRLGLVATAGSDYHGPKVKPKIHLGDCVGQYRIIEDLRRAIQGKG
jgi:predicted metal-dependent phosphoesterase TrpH